MVGIPRDSAQAEEMNSLRTRELIRPITSGLLAVSRFRHCAAKISLLMTRTMPFKNGTH